MKAIDLERFMEIVRAHPGEPHGAYPVLTRVVKVDSDEGEDVHAIGATGQVIASVCHPDTGQLAYLIGWDKTRLVSFCSGGKLMKLEDHAI
jgi:hypothetical protein